MTDAMPTWSFGHDYFLIEVCPLMSLSEKIKSLVTIPHVATKEGTEKFLAI